MKKLYKLFLITLAIFSAGSAYSAITGITVASEVQSCPGVLDGKAWVVSFTTTPGSTGPYVFNWNVAPAPSQTGDTAFNIGGGNFAVTGLDLSDPNPANNAFTQPFFVQSKGVLFVNGFITPESCAGAADGTISALPGGGTPFPGPSYQFSWSPGGSTNQTITSLTQQSYSVTVTDANGCTVDNSFNVGGPLPISINLTIDSVDCNGGSAIATIAPSGGGGSFPTVEWSSTGINTGPTRFVEGGLTTSLPGPNYSVTVTDNSGCTAVESFTILEPTGLTLSIAPDTIDCFGTSTGIAVATVNGGTPPYSYSWNGQPATGSNTENNLAAGPYTLEVIDANGCRTAITPFRIEQRDEIVFNLDSTDVTCFGDGDGTITGTITGGVGPYSWVANDPAGTSGTTPAINVTGLSGNRFYRITVTDNLSCPKIDSIFVNEPTELIASFLNTTEDPNCAGTPTGRIDITFSGGNGGETFNWSGPSINAGNQTQQNQSNLLQGLYSVTITDAKGCDVTIDTNLIDPLPIRGNLTFDQPKCLGGGDARVIATPSDGSGIYTNYQFGDGTATLQNGTDSILTGLSAGTYFVTITDSDGCTGTDNIVVTDPTNPFDLNIVADSVKCNGESTGGATATPTVPLTTGPYLWSWSSTFGGATIGTDSIIAGLPIGKYFITATDGNGCQIVDSIEIEQPDPIATTVTGVDLNCNGDASGTASATISNGNAPYSWVWLDGTTTVLAGNGATASVGGLSAKKYYFDVTDREGCTKRDSITLTEPNAFELTLDSFRLVKCSGENNGAIFVTNSGGTTGPGFPTYTWNDGPTTTQDRIDLVASATPYKVVATDQNGCKDSVIQLITEPNPLTLSIVDTDSLSCPGADDGSATVAASGGTVGNGYVYTWSTTPTQTGATATGLAPGNYTVFVTDSNGCATNPPLSVDIFAPTSITTTISSDSASCSGFNDGSATVVAQDGTPFPGPNGYTYLWDANAGSQTTATAINLLANAPNFYFVTVTDRNGCEKVDSVQVGQPNTLTLSISSQRNVDCAGNSTGAATVNVIGGTLPYTYVWENTGNLGVDIGTNNATLSGLPADTFRITVTDGGGCNDNIQVIITEPDSLKGSITATLSPSCLGSTDGTATATATGGSLLPASDYSYSWNTTPVQTTQTATGLEADVTYTVTISDDSSCVTTVDVTLTAPNVFLTNDSNVQNVSCFNGSDGFIRLTPQGGTPFTPPAAPYNISWTSTTFPSFTANGDSIFNLNSGQYIALIQDSRGCLARDTFNLDQPGTNLSLSFDTTDVSCVGADNGTAKVIVNGGTPGYNYNWEGSPLGDLTDSIFSLATGTYRVTVTDANGCEGIDSTTINPASPISIVTDPANPPQDVTCAGDQDGSINIIASGGGTSLVREWYLLPNRTTPFAGNVSTLTNLSGGTYRVIITDGPCLDSLDIPIIEPDTLKAELNSYDINCDGTILGRAAVNNITGGNTGSKTFLWTPDPGVANGQGTDSVFNLVAGNYRVLVSDPKGCDTTILFTITQTLSNFTFRDSVRNDSCRGASKGYVGIENLSGGVPPYSFQWSNSSGPIVSNDPFLDGIPAETYSVTISDAAGCDSTFTFPIVTEPNPFSVTIVAINDTCLQNKGNASIDPTTITGGTAPFTFTWPGNISGQAVTGLTGDNAYQLTITDANLCTYTEDFTVGNVAPFTISFDIDSVSCEGFANGAIRTTTVGQSTGQTTYTWSANVPSGAGSDISGLLAGDYRLTVTDAAGCEATDTATVEQPDKLEFTSISTVPESCIPGSDGKARAFVIGGNQGNRFNWGDGLGFVNSDSISNLVSGTYSVTVQDKKFCSAVETFQIGDSTPFTINTVIDSVTCVRSKDGEITLSLVGAVAPISYSWSDPALAGQTNNPTGLGVGSYSVTVTDNTTCTVVENIVMAPRSNIQSVIRKEDETCNPGADGYAVVAATGGVGAYSYTWDTKVTSFVGDSAFNLTENDYFVTITDALGCSLITATRIASGANLSINILSQTGPLCFNGTASRTIEATGGIAPYTYTWNDGTVGPTNNNLVAGSTASITIRDSSVPPCEKVEFLSITPVAPISLQVTTTSESCVPGIDGRADVAVTNGVGPFTYAYTGTGTNNGSRYEDLVADNYTVTVTDANGCTSSSNFTIGNAANLPFSASITGTNPTCANGTDGSFTTQVTGGINSLTYTWVGGNGNASSANPTGLSAGIYTVTITRNDFNCSIQLTDTLFNKAPITASFVTVKDDCPPTNTGSATIVNTADGVAPYTYTWPTSIAGSAVSGANGEIFSNLPSGTYDITITDFIGCQQVLPFIIEKSAPFTLTSVVDSVTCNGFSDANITLSVTGVSTPNTETYAWVGPGVNATAQSQTGLGAGTYAVTVTDPANGCEETETYILGEPDTITVVETITNVSCNGGGSDGRIDLLVTGGTPPYNIDWGGGISANPRIGLPIGDYSVTITDASNCAPFIATYSITNQPQFTVSLDSTDISCPGLQNGFITVTTNATSPSYAWSDGLSTAGIRGGLFAGTYTVTVTDGSTGCTVVDSTTINEEDSLKMFFTVTDENCVPGNDAFLVVDSTTGGTSIPNYSYQFSRGNSTGNNAVNQLSAGKVFVTVTDGAGCTAIDSVEIKKSAPFNASFIFTDAICAGDSSGTASVITSNSSGPLTFTWPFGSVINENDSTQNKLLAGTYIVNVFDPVNGCDEDLTIIIGEPDSIKSNPIIVDENCNPGGNGSITLNPTGGDGLNYTYNWTGAGVVASNQNQTGLSAGKYFVTVTDGNSCIGVDSFNVGFIISTVPNLVTTDDGCQLTGPCAGSAKVSPTGGIAPYTFEWASSSGPIVVPNTTDSVGFLCAGNYSVKITDNSGCDTTVLFTIGGNRTILPNAVVIDESCGATDNGSISVTPSGGDAPYSYSWSNSTAIDSIRTNLAPGNYSVTITDATGCIAILDTVIGTENFDYSISSTDLSCNGGNDGTVDITIAGGTSGFTFVWSPAVGNGQGTANVSNLSIGNYSVLITNTNNGCAVTETVDIRPATSINPNEIVADETCFGQNDGSITLGVVGGAGGYTYNWSTNVPAGTTGPIASGLGAGSYSVTITDAAGCDTSINADIIAANDILASITENDATCTNSGICDGSAVLTVTSTGTFSYVWSPGITVVGNDSAAINLCPGNYFVDITNTIGCTKRVNFVIGGPALINPNITVTNAVCNIPNGALSAAPTGGTGALTVEWLDNSLVSIGSGNNINSLSAGAYFADVVDAAGCRDTFPTRINDQGAENITISAFTDVSCFNGSDGTATVSFVCSDPGCTTEWFEAGGTLVGSGTTITGLTEGDYYVEVTNNSGCLAVETVTISEPSGLSISETIVSNDCSGGITGSITLSVSGGAGNFNYVWTPSPTNGQGTNSVSGLSSGTYTVVITDGNGCDSTLSYDIIEPSAISTTFTTSSANCNQADGQIVATVTGGTVATPLAYDYQWFDGNNTLLVGQTTDTLRNVPSGNYRLRVRDDNSCQQLFTVSLSDLNGPSVVVDSLFNAGCFGESNGGIFITASGNNPPFNYNWLPSGAVSEDLTSLAAGAYSVQVTDNLGCITLLDTSVTESSELMAVISAADATCGECNGTASVVVTGGTAPYTYLWSDGATANNTDSLCGGNYSLVVTDASGCSKSFDFGVNTIGGPTGETVSITPASCANSNDGSASVVPVGGTPPYSYLWQHNGATTSSLNNLAAGTYFIQISDVRSCSRTVEIVIQSPTAIELNPQVISSTCNQSDGSILLNVTGGLPPYSYNWFTASLADTNFIDNRPAGLYPVSVTDANGCVESLTIAINNTGLPFVPNPIATDVSCFGQCDGSLENNISTTGIVNFIWLDDQRNSIAPINTDVLNSVCAGNYFLELTTIADGCISYVPVTITEPDSITLSSNIIKNITCNGDCDGEIFINTRGGNILYSYSWSDPNNQSKIPATGLCAGTYTVTATDANGCTAITSTTLVDPPLLTASITSNTNLVCSSDCDATATSITNGGNPPYTYLWSGGQTDPNPTNLCFGENIFTVTDASGCSISDTIMISATDTVIAISSGNPLVCDGDIINLIGDTVGSSVATVGWYLDATATSLFTNTLDTSFNAPVGTYTYYLVASSASGLCVDIDTFTVTVAPNPLVNLESQIRRFGEEQTVIVLGNEDPSYTYKWTPPTDLDFDSIAEPTTFTEEDITYRLTVTDTNGCTYTDSVLVLYLPNIDVPSGFTPNGDGTNDVWNIRLLEKFPNASVQIYNRWGQLLYEQSNGYSAPWDGTYEGEELPIGTYYYIIDLKDPVQKPLTGPITIVR